MADDKQPIVIKKVYEEGHGHHGGAWKVAFADFMTAMMCFFLVMWLINQTAEVKAQVASYFTGPSMLEHDFTSYGAELTLEKLFLDLVNEPFKAIQDFMQPADFTPNVLNMGTKKIVLHHVAKELGAIATNVKVESDRFVFEIPERYLFKNGSANPAKQFVEIMSRVEAITMGLDNAIVDIESNIYLENVPSNSANIGQSVANNRLDILKNKISNSLEHGTVDVIGQANVKRLTKPTEGTPSAMIRFEIRQKKFDAKGRKPRPIESLFGDKNNDLNVYDDFVRRISEEKKQNK